ncbi:MAG: phosphoribosylformimino-5-aminoimidazole carboxamide ribotide isomerase [Clostridia bacterium]|nr:phosphoribosylformimino-5-aminoimidazole carboxamide ribotide isomerase [Clostridia bacterium]
MLVIPAIDLREGRCVRLYQGRLEEETVFSTDPVAVAKEWARRGAAWLHVVDLDGAFAGTPRNLEIIEAIARAVNIPVQVGGGIRTVETCREVLERGAARAVLGTAAISSPEVVAAACEAFGDRVAVGIDSRAGLVAVEGWAVTVPKTALQLALEVRALGIGRVIYTDTSRDGTLTGLNLEATRQLAAESGLKIIASGGVSSLEDIEALKELEPLGVEGVIVGRALYTGAVSLEDAIARAGV